MDKPVGIIPVLNDGALGLPYPCEVYSVEEGRLIIDYALHQLALSGINHVIIPVASRWFVPLANYLGRLRGGIEIDYLEIAATEPQFYASYAYRGLYKANYTHGYDHFIIINPRIRIFDCEITPGKILEGPDCSLSPLLHSIRSEAIKAIRKGVRGKDADILEKIAPPLPVTPEHYNLGTWAGVREYTQRKFG